MLALGDPIMTFQDKFQQIVNNLNDTKPKPNATYSYNFDLGQEITQTTLSNTTIYSREKKDKQNGDEADQDDQYLNINLLNDDFVFQDSLTSYLKSNFLDYNCNETDNEIFDQIKYYGCPANGISTNGMPTIILKDREKELFEFNSSDYFIYPTHLNSTSAIQSQLGIQIFHHVNYTHTVSFGRLFVQKYGLRLEYSSLANKDQETFLEMKVLTGYNYESEDDSTILEMLFWLLLFTILNWIVYKMFKLKKERLVREETMFYQIYNNIKSSDPSAMNKSENDILK